MYVSIKQLTNLKYPLGQSTPTQTFLVDGCYLSVIQSVIIWGDVLKTLNPRYAAHSEFRLRRTEKLDYGGNYIK